MTQSNSRVKTALVTGSTSGIGLSIAQALSAAGWRIALHGLGSADEVAKAIASLAARLKQPIACRKVGRLNAHIPTPGHTATQSRVDGRRGGVFMLGRSE